MVVKTDCMLPMLDDGSIALGGLIARGRAIWARQALGGALLWSVRPRQAPEASDGAMPEAVVPTGTLPAGVQLHIAGEG